jgi:predicted metal-dependent hydrolase
MRMISRHAIELHERIMRRGTKTRVSDADLFERAAKLRSRYLPKHTPQPSSIRWVTNQRRRWGSCTPVDQTIRLSSRLQNMPDYVVDYVIVHELAHLLVSTHGPEFKALVALYPHATKAEAFLQGVEFAGAMDPLDADEPTAEPEPA